MNATWIPAVVFLLGAYHGLNPAMGWLFAVALAMQDRSGRAIFTSLLPLGAGHLLSVGAILAIAQVARYAMPLGTVRTIAALALIAFAAYRLARRRHPRWVGMRVGSADLVLWSFLMASAHGAGLMLLPFVLASPAGAVPPEHVHHAMLAHQAMFAGGAQPGAAAWWFPAALHTAGYLLATAAVALGVYHKLGVSILRRAWFNLDLLWIGTLLVTAGVTLAI